MGLADGDLFVSGSILSYQQANRIYQNFRGATVPSALQAGALWSRSTNDKLYHQGASLDEVYTIATELYNWKKGADKPSANALDLSALDGNYFDVTGVTAITSITFESAQPGTIICLHFDGILDLTHHATNLILPTGATITTAAGDEAILIEYDTAKWRCIGYLRASGVPLAGGGGLANVVEDVTPQLGGDLDLNGKNIDFPSTPNISDVKDEDNMASDSPTMLATQQSIKKYVDDNIGGLANIVEDATPQLGGDLDLNTKNIDFPTTPNISDCLDEDNMVSNSAVKLATQQSIKAYADTKGPTWGATVKWKKGADKASANALDISALDGNYFDVTGVTAITSMSASGQVGTIIGLHFDGILVLTHHATDLILPTGANISTAAGDEAIFVEYATGDWRCINYLRADGTPLAGGGGATDKIEEGNSSVEVIDAGTGYIETKADAQQVRKDALLGNIQPKQPAFLAWASSVVNVTGDTTQYTLIFNNEIYDQGGNWNGTSLFTAPVQGIYSFKLQILANQFGAGHTYCYLKFVSTLRTYIREIALAPAPGSYSFFFAQELPMNLGNTLSAIIQVGNDTKVIDVYGDGNLHTFLSGRLVC